MPRLRRYVRPVISDTGSADDLVQTTLERALSHWHPFDQRRDLLVWLLSIAHNAFIDQRRHDSRLSIIDPALGRLPLDQRVPLLLVSVEQLSYAKCAEALGILIGTVMSRASRGRAALRESLDGRSRSAGVTTLRRVS